jgi:hypothetical protein
MHPVENPALTEIPPEVEGFVFLHLKLVRQGKNSVPNTVYHIIVSSTGVNEITFYGFRSRNGGAFKMEISDSRKFSCFPDVQQDIGRVVFDLYHPKLSARKAQRFSITAYQRYRYDKKTLGMKKEHHEFLDELKTPTLHVPYETFSSGNLMAFDVCGNDLACYPLKNAHSALPLAERVILSKEDWLKVNYPEMSELPKWRFPGMAVA